MAYQHDVFISYKSSSREWLQEIFLPPFEHFLKNKIGDGAKVYVDWHDIKTGSIWELSLKNGLAESKCLVSLMMPTYFDSEWCKREFAVFEHRSRHCGLLLGGKQGLIVPVILNDARPFPTAVSSFQNDIHYGKYYVPNTDGFKRRKKWGKFQEEIKTLVDKVAEALELAQDWHPDWQTDAFLEVPTTHLDIANYAVKNPIL